MPAPPAVPCPAGTGGQQAGPVVSGPGIGVPVTAQIIAAFSGPGELVVIPEARDAKAAAERAQGQAVRGAAQGRARLMGCRRGGQLALHGPEDKPPLANAESRLGRLAAQLRAQRVRTCG